MLCSFVFPVRVVHCFFVLFVFFRVLRFVTIVREVEPLFQMTAILTPIEHSTPRRFRDDEPNGTPSGRE